MLLSSALRMVDQFSFSEIPLPRVWYNRGMSLDPDLADRVLTLPFPERVELIRRLAESLEPVEDDPEAAALWEAEIQARTSRFESGETRAGDAYEAIDRITRKVLGGEGQ